jgi:hypothetical protein
MHEMTEALAEDIEEVNAAPPLLERLLAVL